MGTIVYLISRIIDRLLLPLLTLYVYHAWEWNTEMYQKREYNHSSNRNAGEFGGRNVVWYIFLLFFFNSNGVSEQYGPFPRIVRSEMFVEWKGKKHWWLRGVLCYHATTFLVSSGSAPVDERRWVSRRTPADFKLVAPKVGTVLLSCPLSRLFLTSMEPLGSLIPINFRGYVWNGKKKKKMNTGVTN